jgi:hypothetical protein
MIQSNIEDEERVFQLAYRDRLQAERRAGFREGLAVAVQIRDWLTRQPDRKWQQEVRLIADRVIAEAKKQYELPNNDL